MRDFGGKLAFVFEVLEAIEFRLERRKSLRVESLLVHTSGVIIADLLRVGVAIGSGLCGLFQNLMEGFAIALRQFVEAAPMRLVGWDRIGFHPGTARVLVEVLAG